MESKQVNNQDLSTEDAIIEALTLTCKIELDGTKIYLNKEGEFHRIYGPAISWANGNQHWYKNGKRHRDHKPAVIFADGKGWWYKDGQRHREDGPAAIYDDDSEDYFINDKKLTKKEFIQWQKDNGIKPIE